jgi:hypothetical protein
MEQTTAEVVQRVLSMPVEEQKQVAAQSLQALPEAAKEDVAAGAGLARPTGVWNSVLWLLIVTSFCVVLVGGAYIVYVMSRDDVDTSVFVPVVTTVLGALVGLLAPSPVQTRRESGGS